MTRSITRPVAVRHSLLAAAVAACFAAPAWAAGPTALPSGATNLVGVSNMAYEANKLTITTSAARSSADWDKFSVPTGMRVDIFQPTATSAMMNRVVSANPSQIYGTLWSNGQVWLVNQAGIQVGPGGMVDTAGFVASTLNVNPADFLAGKLNFLATPGAGDVVNQGTITTPSGGFVYLIGGNVSNEGIIHTPQGETLLAAGQTVNLVDTGTPGVKVEITGAEGNATNLGTITAEAGRIGIAGVLVKNSGTLNASSVVSEGGRVFLKSTGDTYVEGNSRIEATGMKGGRVEVLGDRVAVTDNAVIDASGANGGGTILVGGDYQGKNADIQNARFTYFGPNATLKADATDNGNGGKVILWADDTTRAYGTISARGGSNGGDGGFVETSGESHLDYRAQVDLRAPLGIAGNLLLDPSDIIIDNISDILNGGAFSGGIFEGVTGTSHLTWNTINTQLGFGSLVIRTSSGGGGNGDITIDDGGSLTASNTLTLLANRNLNFSSGAAVTTVGDLNLVAGWNNTGWSVSGGSGSLNFATGSSLNVGGNLWINVATAMGVQAGASVLANGNLEIGTVLTATVGDILINGSVTSTGITQTINTSGTISVAGSMNGAASLTHSGSGTQTIKGSSLDVLAHQNGGIGGDNYYAKIVSSGGGTQVIDISNAITLDAGGDSMYGGHGNYALIEANGVQQITANQITLTGGSGSGAGGYENFAKIRQNSTGGTQTITINGTNGFLTLTGGSGNGMGGSSYDTCGSECTGHISGNSAAIENDGSGGQTINFSGSGSKTLTLLGGTVGNANDAYISQECSTGAQQITGGADIILNDGNSGGVIVHSGSKDYHVDNSAGISSESTQTITAASIIMTADNIGGLGGAYIGSQGAQTLNVTSALTLNASADAPSSNLDINGATLSSYNFGSAAAIGSEGNANVTLNVGSLFINSSTANTAYGSSAALIGSMGGTANVTITSTGVINVASATANAHGSNVMIGSRLGLGGSVTLDNLASTANIATNQAYIGTSVTSGTVDILAGGAISQTANGKIFGNTTNLAAKKGINLAGSVYGTETLRLIAGWDGVSSLTSPSTPNAFNIFLGATSRLYASTSSGTITLQSGDTGGGIAQAGGGIITGKTLVAKNAAASSIGLVGNNMVDEVTLLAPTGDITYYSSKGFHLLNAVAGYPSAGVFIWALSGGFSVLADNIESADGITVYASGNANVKNASTTGTGKVITIKSGYDGSYTAGYGTTLGSIDANGGTVMVDAGGGIYTHPTSPGQIAADTVNLHSVYGGNAGELAISSDVTGAGTVTALVDSTATYGGIRVSHTGVMPGTVQLQDDAISNEKVTFYNDASFTLSSGPTYRFKTTNGGSVNIGSGGDLTYNAGGIITTGLNGSLHLGAAGNLTVASQLDVAFGANAGSSASLAAGGTLTVQPGAAVMTNGGNINLFAGTINLQDQVTATNADANLAASLISLSGGGKVTAQSIDFATSNFIGEGGGSYLYASSGDIRGLVLHDLTLNDGAHFKAPLGDIKLKFMSGNSTLTLNDDASYANKSYFNASPDTVHLHFAGRSNGGVVLDGVESLVTTAGGSGFYTGGFGGTPLLKGAGLEVTYGVTGMDSSIIKAILKALDKRDDAGPPPSPRGGDSTLLAAGDQSVGGGEGEFGEKKDGDKEGRNGDGQRRNRDDDKDGKKGGKHVGQCS